MTNPVEEVDPKALIAKLRHLVSLNEPKNGGPFGGFAAQECVKAMQEAADALAASPSVGVRVKPLVWSQSNVFGKQKRRGSSPFGEWTAFNVDGLPPEAIRALEETAQRDYEANIMAALLPHLTPSGAQASLPVGDAAVEAAAIKLIDIGLHHGWFTSPSDTIGLAEIKDVAALVLKAALPHQSREEVIAAADAWLSARMATLAEPVADVRKSPDFAAKLNALSEAEDRLASAIRELKGE